MAEKKSKKQKAQDLSNQVEEKSAVLRSPMKDLRKRKRKTTATALRTSDKKTITKPKKVVKIKPFSLYQLGEFTDQCFLNRPRLIFFFPYALFFTAYFFVLALLQKMPFITQGNFELWVKYIGNILFVLIFYYLSLAGQKAIDSDVQNKPWNRAQLKQFARGNFIKLILNLICFFIAVFILSALIIAFSKLGSQVQFKGWLEGFLIVPFLMISVVAAFLFAVGFKLLPAAMLDENYSALQRLKIMLGGFLKAPLVFLINLGAALLIGCLIFLPLLLMLAVAFYAILIIHNPIWQYLDLSCVLNPDEWGYLIMFGLSFWLALGALATLFINYQLTAAYYVYNDLKRVLRK